MAQDRIDTSERTAPQNNAPPESLYSEVYRMTRPGENPTGQAPGGERREVANGDGSKVVVGKGPDGNDQPLKITYSDGRSTEYAYAPDGKVMGVRNLDAQGNVVDSYISRDGKTFVDQISGNIREGSITVNPNGTGKFTDLQGNTFEGRTDGKAVLTMKDAGGQTKSYLMGADGSVSEITQRAESTVNRTEQPRDIREETSPDGSKVVFGKTADGKEHPIQITYTDGRSTQYEYSADGNVQGVKNVDAEGRVLESYRTTDGRKWVEENSGVPIEGTLAVNDKGIPKFTFANGDTIEPRADGKAVWMVKDQSGQERKFVISRDGSAIEYGVVADGKEHPTRVRFPDGTETTYEYDQDGRITAVTEWTRGGEAFGRRRLRYETKNGTDWTEATGKAPNLRGNLRLSDNGQHSFADAASGSTFVRNADGSVQILDAEGKEINPQEVQPRPRQ